MEEQLVSLETAKLAKEKGFTIYTQKVYVETLEHTLEMGRGGDRAFPYQATRVLTSGKFDEWDVVHCKAPTQSLLQKWLREVHNIHLKIEISNIGRYYYQLYHFEPKNKSNVLFFINQDTNQTKHNTYEEALEVGLQEACNLVEYKTI